jgi:aspartate aminotransferase
VAAVAGAPFGAPGYIRFSYASSEEDIDGGIRAIRAAIALQR